MARIDQTITVNAPLEACYQVWADFPNYPSFMPYVQEVHQHNPSHHTWVWTLTGPTGKPMVWDLAVELPRPDRGHHSISWYSVRQADVRQAGAVTLNPVSPEQTQVRIVIEYEPPLDVLGGSSDELVQGAYKAVQDCLQGFRQKVEAAPIPAGHHPSKPTNSESQAQQNTEHPRTKRNEWQLTSSDIDRLKTTQEDAEEYKATIAPDNTFDSL